MAQRVKNPPAMQEMQGDGVWSLDWEDPLEEEVAPHSSVLAWKIPWTEEPGELQSMGSRIAGHDWMAEHTHPSLILISVLWVSFSLGHSRYRCVSFVGLFEEPAFGFIWFQPAFGFALYPISLTFSLVYYFIPSACFLFSFLSLVSLGGISVYWDLRSLLF